MSTESSLLRYCSTNIPIWGMYEKEVPVEVEGVVKLVVDSTIAKIGLNYTGKLTDNDMDYGEVYEEGNATGVLGILARGEADIGFSVSAPSYTNVKQVEFTNIVVEDEWMVLSSVQAVKFESNATSIFNVLDRTTWIVFGCALLFFSIAWMLTESVYKGFKNPKKQSEKFPRKIFNYLFYSISAGLGHGESNSDHLGSRIIITMWVIACFIVMQCISGGILAKLTLPPKGRFIDELKDLLEHPNLPIYIVRNTAPHEHFQKPIGETAEKVQDQIKKHNMILNTEDIAITEVFNDLEQNRLAIYLPKDVILEGVGLLEIYDIFEQKIHLSREATFKTNAAFPLKKNGNPYITTVFKKTVQHLFETGIIFYARSWNIWKTYYHLGENRIIEQNQKRLELKHFQLGFVFISLSLFITLLVLGFEIRFHKSRSSRCTNHAWR